MFTGIVTAIGTIREASQHGDLRAVISCPWDPAQIAIVCPTPAGASVHLGTPDAKPLGKTPLDGTIAPGTHKGAAVAWLAAQHGLTPDDVAAVGDQANDREMLTMAGRSAAMGGAPDEIAACADIVVPSSSDSGVLDAFAWFFPDLAPSLMGEAAA